MAATYNRRLRITAAPSYSVAENNCATMTSTQINGLLHNNCTTLTVLYARRIVLSLILRSLRSCTDTRRLERGETPLMPPLFVAMAQACRMRSETTSSKATSSKVESTTQLYRDHDTGADACTDQFGLKLPGGAADITSALGMQSLLTPSSLASNSIPSDDNVPIATAYTPFLEQLEGATLTEGQRRGDLGGAISDKTELEVEEKEGIVSSTDDDRPTTYELAQLFICFLKLSLFRGEPSYSTGLESLSLTTVDALSAHLGNISITLDTALSPLLNILLSHMDSTGLSVASSPIYPVAGTDTSLAATNASSKEDSFRLAFLHLLVNSIAHNITLACSPAQMDYCWGDGSYMDDQDLDCVTSANIHFAQWISKGCLQVGAAPVTYSVFMAWTYSLRGPSMSLKEVGCNVLAPLLATVAASFRAHPSVQAETLLSACLDLLPRERLNPYSIKAPLV